MTGTLCCIGGGPEFGHDCGPGALNAPGAVWYGTCPCCGSVGADVGVIGCMGGYEDGPEFGIDCPPDCGSDGGPEVEPNPNRQRSPSGRRSMSS